jgi:hypothetical protein
VLDHDRPLEHGPHAYLLAVDHCVEATTDLVVQGWDDACQRNEIGGGFAHLMASSGWAAVV